MTVTPTNLFSVPLTRMQTLLAAVAAFQTWVGADDAAEAAEAIHLVDFDEPDRASMTDAEYRAARALQRPLAIVGFEPGMEASEDSADPVYMYHAGSLTVLLEEIAQNENGVATGDNPVTDRDAIVHLMNVAGAILEGIEAANGRDGYLKVIGWTHTEGPGRMHPDDVAAGELDIATVKMQIRWAEI